MEESNKRSENPVEAEETNPTKKPKKTNVLSGLVKKEKPELLSKFYKWCPMDDLLLVEAVESNLDPIDIVSTVKFQTTFSMDEVTERWEALLYDKEISKKAVEAMNVIRYNTKRIPWMKEEDEIIINELKEKGHISFQHLIDRNRYKFHPSRTVRSLEAHFYRLKRAGEFEVFEKLAAEEKKSNETIKDEGFDSIEDIMDEVVEKKISTKMNKSEILKEKREAKQAIKLEKEHYLNQVNTNEDINNPVFAELVGEKITYKVRKVISYLGRKGKKNNCQIDFELSKTGNLQTSKQQAIIELQKTKTNSFQFLLKNLGKKSIFVDDFEVIGGSEKYINHQNFISFPLGTTPSKLDLKKFLFSIHKNEIEKWMKEVMEKDEEEKAPPSQITKSPQENITTNLQKVTKEEVDLMEED
eukprot:gene859-9108_t